ncbi:MAG TPA: transglutaminase domain-containing protein [Flavobacterium sp.]|jgi:transglutaminase/protease-like cytokinesis protein 3
MLPLKPTIFSILLFFLFNTVFAQDYSSVDAKVRAYPDFAKPELLAAKIAADFTTDELKARAIFTWIASNIKYDVPQYFASGGVRQAAFSYRTEAEKAQKEQQFKNQIVMQTWRSGKAVCHGYSELYNFLANQVGLESVLIPGVSKTHPTHIGKLPTVADHAWNAVKANGKWQLVDVTWAAGGIDGATKKFLQKFNDSYFFTDPEVFFLNHFPDDKRLLMINKTPEEFARLPLYYGEYLSSEYTIVSPNDGIIRATAASIPFRINNFSGARIAYVFSSNNTFHTVSPTVSGDTVEFDVPVSKGDSGFLTLYIGSSSVVTYKIQRG